MKMAWVAERRLSVLVAALLIAVVLRVAGDAWPLHLVAGLLLPFPLILWAAVADRSFYPARLVARPLAFDVPATPGIVLGAAGYTFLAVSVVDGSVRDIAEGDDVWFSAILAAVVTVLLVVFWRAALGRFGVRLRPDGIVDRQVLGSLFVPWDALTTPLPAYPYDAKHIGLFLARPDLVRRRGLRRGDRTALPATGVDAELLTRAIREYANHADRRSAIGSAEELTRLQAIPRVRAYEPGRPTC